MGPCKYRIAALAIGLSTLGLGTPVRAQTPRAPEFTFEGDMVLGHACVLTSQFKPFQSVVWRIRVTDPKTGQSLDDKGLKSLVVQLSDGQSFPMKFGTHPKPGPAMDTYWATSWMIPENHPTGSFSYKIVATDLDGKTTEWEPFKVSSSQFTIAAK